MKSLIAAALVSTSLLGSMAFAQEATEVPAQSFESSLTRAEVQQELAQARAEGRQFEGETEDSNAAYVDHSQHRQTPSARHQTSPRASQPVHMSFNNYGVIEH